MKSVADMAAAHLVTPAAAASLAPVAARYAVAITPAMAALIDTADPADPIARQFVPDIRELDVRANEHADPIGDHAHSPVAGLVHRYADRVLLKLSGVCPVYCRFCFRREMVGPGAGTTLTDAETAVALAYIARTPAVWEVIVTGGDPLILSPRRIRAVTEALAAIAHIKIIRWHTRVPVVAPERITAELAHALTATHQAVYVAVHANHPRELTPAARAAIATLSNAGIALVSQTVLLRGVNDTVATLDSLMRAFVECRVKPYYLHHGDLAPGTSHFRLPLSEGQALVAALRRQLSGLAMPVYTLDIPGGYGKVPAGPAHVALTGDGEATVTDPNGGHHRYDDTQELLQNGSRD